MIKRYEHKNCQNQPLKKCYHLDVGGYARMGTTYYGVLHISNRIQTKSQIDFRYRILSPDIKNSIPEVDSRVSLNPIANM